MPLWLIAVILPLISILVFIVMFVALYKVRQQNAKCQTDSLPRKTGKGTDNVTFCFDDNRALADAASAERETHEPMTADQQRSSVEFYCDASPSSVQPEPNSELEYYEINSISSAFHSDTASLKHSWHKHLYSTKCVKADPRRWGDLKMLFTGFKKERFSGEEAMGPTKCQNAASLNKQLLTMIDAEQPQNALPCYTNEAPQPELMKPVQCLTFEEISKLNAPLERTMPHAALLKSGPAKTAMVMDVSSDCETDSTFTWSESECGQVSVINTRKYGHDQSSLSAHSFRQQDIPNVLVPASTLFKHNCHSGAGHHTYDGAPSSMFEQWENILQMHLPFSSYVSVFEDIACLPMAPSHSYDMQSDIEEII